MLRHRDSVSSESAEESSPGIRDVVLAVQKEAEKKLMLDVIEGLEDLEDGETGSQTPYSSQKNFFEVQPNDFAKTVNKVRRMKASLTVSEPC